MKTRIAFIFILLAFIPLWSYGQVCAASSQSCEFYSCMEEKTHCGKNGYWKKLGLHYCQKFLFRENQFSSQAQEWLRASRLCLQERAQDFDVAKMTCQQMQSQALETHIGCYVDTGFCELSVQDRNKVYWHLSSSLVYPDIWRQAIKIRQICQSQGAD